MGLLPTPWVEEQYSQCKTQRAQGAPSTSGWRAISETELHSKVLSRSDRVSDRVSRLNYSTIDNCIDDDTDDRCSRSI